MNVKVIDHTPVILVKNARAINLALRMMLDGIDQEAFRNTPKKKGELRKDIFKNVSANSGKIQWRERYAATQEAGVIKGRRIRNYTTAGTGPKYAENAVTKVVRDSVSYMKKAGVV